LKIFQGNLGREERVPKVLEKAIKTICPQMDDTITHHVLEDLECLILPIFCKHVSSAFCSTLPPYIIPIYASLKYG
jgi:hypothetical protein